MPKVLILGGILVERHFFVDTLPEAGQIAISNQDLKIGITSKVINGGRIIAKYFPTTIQGTVGMDPDGDFALQELKKFEIDSQLASRVSSQPTGQVIIFTDQKAQAATIFHAGANQKNNFSIKSKEFDCLYLSTTAPLDTIYQTLENINSQTLTLLDPPSYPDKLNWDRLKKLNYITANRSEAKKMLGEDIPSAKQAVGTAIKLSHKINGTAIITLDQEGCVIANERIQQHLKAPATKTVDSTGAGDILRGVFLTKLLQGNNVLNSLKIGVDIASRSTQIRGVYPSIKFALKTLDS